MAYNYDSEQQAAIDKFLADTKEFITSFFNGEEANAATFNKRRNETQGVLAKLKELLVAQGEALEAKQKSISVQEIEPTSPSLNDFWIDTSNTPALYKYWNGTEWTLIGGAANGISDLTDVVITNPTSGQVLRYNGSKWVNSEAPSGSGGGSGGNGYGYGGFGGAVAVPTRQTVLSGEINEQGYPNLLEGNGLNVNLKASSKPCILAFADGYDDAGAIDYVESINNTIPAAWTVPVSTTSYLYIDRSPTGGLSYGSSSLTPIYSHTFTEALQSLVPVMTSNTAPFGVVIFSQEKVGYEAYKAFDQSSTYDGGWGAPVTPNWIGYNFETNKPIIKYSVTIRDTSRETTPYGIRQAPKTWTFEGSNDGVNWTILDTRTNITDWAYKTPKEFLLAEVVSYSQYRINIASPVVDGETISIGELAIFGYTTPIDQHWFDLNEMKMKVWDGSSWVNKQRVFIGEVTTNASTTTSTITYAFQGKYDSGAFSVASNTMYSKNHNLGVTPLRTQVLLRKDSNYQWSYNDFFISNTSTYNARLTNTTLVSYLGFGTYVSFGGTDAPYGNLSFPSANATSGEARIIVERGW